MGKKIKKSLAFKNVGRLKRHTRIRGKICGTQKRPRLCVFRSEKHIYAQLIDDSSQKVLFGISSLSKDIKIKKGSNLEESQTRESPIQGSPTQAAGKVGEAVAKKALAQKISHVVFDAAGYKYHGRVKALADGARKGGLKF